MVLYALKFLVLALYYFKDHFLADNYSEINCFSFIKKTQETSNVNKKIARFNLARI